MKVTKSKWLAYTVLVGLIPLLTRGLVWATTKAGTVSPIAPTDLIAFGLVLHISIINELEHVSRENRAWKTCQNGASVLFIAVYGALSAVTLVADKSSLVDVNVMLKSTLLLALVSFVLCLSVVHRLSMGRP
jgi:hypothetical protein